MWQTMAPYITGASLGLAAGFAIGWWRGRRAEQEFGQRAWRERLGMNPFEKRRPELKPEKTK